MLRKAALVGAMVVVAAAASAKTIPKVGSGQSYVAARAHVFDGGWRANGHDASGLSPPERQLRAWYLERGFDEIESCAGEGGKVCTAVFHAGGYTLTYFLTSGAKESVGPGGPKILTYCLGTATVKCDPPGS